MTMNDLRTTKKEDFTLEYQRRFEAYLKDFTLNGKVNKEFCQKYKDVLGYEKGSCDAEELKKRMDDEESEPIWKLCATRIYQNREPSLEPN